jgi:hypothetical protein
MNKSQIYLATVAILLSFAAVRSVKAARRTLKVRNGYTRGGVSCNFVRAFTSVTTNSAFDAGTTIKTFNKTVFTRGISLRCGAVLHHALID